MDDEQRRDERSWLRFYYGRSLGFILFKVREFGWYLKLFGYLILGGILFLVMMALDVFGRR